MTSGLLPDGDERHLKALEAAENVLRAESFGRLTYAEEADAIVAAYFKALGVRFVDASEVAEWLRSEAAGGERFPMDDGSMSYGLWATDDWADAFLRQFGGGDA